VRASPHPPKRRNLVNNYFFCNERLSQGMIACNRRYFGKSAAASPCCWTGVLPCRHGTRPSDALARRPPPPCLRKQSSSRSTTTEVSPSGSVTAAYTPQRWAQRHAVMRGFASRRISRSLGPEERKKSSWCRRTAQAAQAGLCLIGPHLTWVEARARTGSNRPVFSSSPKRTAILSLSTGRGNAGHEEPAMHHEATLTPP